MTQNQNPPEPVLPPGPDPALKRLERFVGTWNVTGRTLDSEQDNVSGRFTFEWLPGGFFLQQRTELNFAGYQVRDWRSSATTQPPTGSLRPSTPAWSGSRSPTSTTCTTIR